MAKDLGGLVDWLGLRGGEGERSMTINSGDEVPLWHGVDRRREAGVKLTALVLGFIVFFTLRSWLDGVHDAGLPLIVAVMTYALVTTVGERLNVRA